MNITNGYLAIYYNMIIAYSFYYLVLSLTSKLPWENCNPSWSSISTNYIESFFLLLSQKIIILRKFSSFFCCFRIDCLDDYQNNFTYLACDNANLTLQCPNGKCYNLTTLSGSTANCALNQTDLQYVGWWKPQFPSQDYWM